MEQESIPPMGGDFSQKLRKAGKTLGDIFYGFTVHELDREIRKEQGHHDNLFMLIIFGDPVGLPCSRLTTP